MARRTLMNSAGSITEHNHGDDNGGDDGGADSDEAEHPDPNIFGPKTNIQLDFNTFCLFLKDWGAMQGPIQESYGTPGLSHSSYQISFVCVF